MTTSSRFDVWAPFADAVTLVLVQGTTRTEQPLAKDSSNWWRAVDPDPAQTFDYGYLLRGDRDAPVTPVPDPRSPWQPHGVHELSRTFDTSAFTWTDTAWHGRPLAGAIIYELHLGTFTPEGTLAAAATRFDHLKSIGVDFIELMPVNAFNGEYNWGYDGVGWYAVHHGYGGPAAYQEFVNAAHAAGLGVIQDVVYNHLGPSGNYLGLFGPYQEGGSATTWGTGLNLDGDQSDEVRAMILENALRWQRDFHVDGLRLDAVHALSDTSDVHLLKQFAIDSEVLTAATGVERSLIAESDLNDPIMFLPREAKGYGLAGAWNDDFHHALHVALTGEISGYYADFEPLSALAKVLHEGYFHAETYSSFRGKVHGKKIDLPNTDSWRLVVANQNHDQIGNRAIGDRLTASLDTGQLAIAAALTLLGPFTPMLFMGEEWAASTPFAFFTSHPEPELGRATAEGRIAEFARMGWDESAVPDPQARSTFENSKLAWDELNESHHSSMLRVYQALAALRGSDSAFTDPRFGEVSVAFTDEPNTGTRCVVLSRGPMRIAVNFADAALPLSASTDSLADVANDAATILFESESVLAGSQLPTRIEALAPHSVTVFRVGTVEP